LDFDSQESLLKSTCIIPAKKAGTGAIICLAKERLPLTDNVWILPVQIIQETW
jgi:hypothetical protein